MNKYVRLLRVPQWYKNLVVFLALFYTKNLFTVPMLSKSVLGFVSLCLISSSYYILNDIHDRQEDKKHPEKKTRPIASGEIDVKTGFFISIILFSASMMLGYTLRPLFALYAIGLFVSSNLYTVWLKHIPFVDIHVISVNFLLRAIAGAVVINVPASPWLIATIFFMALFLAIAKRKGDFLVLDEKAIEHKKVYRVYNLKLLDDLLVFTTALLLFTYILYTFMAYESKLLMATIPFASIILMRYLYLVEDGHIIARKTQYFFKDKQLTVTLILWIISSYAILSIMP